MSLSPASEKASPSPEPAPSSANMRLPSLLLTVTVTLMGVVVSEFVLRHWFPIGSIMGPDQRCFYKYIPNSSKLKLPFPGSGADTVVVRINPQGRRGEPLSKDCRPRIIVYGDSFIAAEGVSPEKAFVYRLRQTLGQRLSQPVEVINAGVTGYGPDQESLMMEDDIPSLDPDLVVFAIYTGNDFGDLLRNKLFRLDEHNQLVAGHPTLCPRLQQDFRGAANQSRFQVVRRLQGLPKAIRASGIGRMLRNLVRAGKAPAATDGAPVLLGSTEQLQQRLVLNREEYEEYVLKHDVVYNLFLDTYEADLSLHPQLEASQYKRLFMERMMERIESIAASRNTTLMFLFIPTAIDMGNWDISVEPGLFPDYRPNELTGALEEVACKHRVPYLNLFETFRAHRTDNLYFHAGDDHWNATGQDLAAIEVANYILRCNLLRNRAEE